MLDEVDKQQLFTAETQRGRKVRKDDPLRTLYILYVLV